CLTQSSLEVELQPDYAPHLIALFLYWSIGCCADVDAIGLVREIEQIDEYLKVLPKPLARGQVNLETMVQPGIVVDSVAYQQRQETLIVERDAAEETFVVPAQRGVAHILRLARQNEITPRQFRIRMHVSVIGIDVEVLEKTRQKIRLAH